MSNQKHVDLCSQVISISNCFDSPEQGKAAADNLIQLAIHERLCELLEKLEVKDE